MVATYTHSAQLLRPYCALAALSCSDYDDNVDSLHIDWTPVAVKVQEVLSNMCTVCVGGSHALHSYTVHFA